MGAFSLDSVAMASELTVVSLVRYQERNIESGSKGSGESSYIDNSLMNIEYDQRLSNGVASTVNICPHAMSV